LLKELANLGNILRQAQQMGGRMQEIAERLKGKRVLGSAGGGMVQVEANGLGEILRVTIDGDLVARNEREMIEDLLPAATNQALKKAKELHADEVRSLTAGMQLPGLDEALSQMTGNTGPAS
jgi:DNA-binding YbaB/EbfC family protein